MSKGVSEVPVEAARVWRRMRINPLASLTATSLVRALDNFEYGYLREAALLWDVIADRDDTLKSVKPKREKEVSQLGWQVTELGEADGVSGRHKETLEEFWRNVRAVNVYDRNERGGFARLVRQMMGAVSNRYAVHHIVWRPTGEGLRATFEFVPLWLFENTTGELRYLEDPFAREGVAMEPDEWMVTCGDGLMVACAIGYFAKRQTFNDWLIFSEKFALPGVLGRTSARKGSAEGIAMREAVKAFGHDWVSVLYGDDGSVKEPIQLIQAQGNPSAMPQPALIERVDRKFAALYRGADLSTMSAGSGEGSGASLQGKEKDILLADDAEVISETLEAVSRYVIEWTYGRGVEPRARLELVVPMVEDGRFVLEAAMGLANAGARVSKRNVMDRLGILAAVDDGDVLGKSEGRSLNAEGDEKDAVKGLANTLQTVANRLDANNRVNVANVGDRRSGAILEGFTEVGGDEEFLAAAGELLRGAMREDAEPVLEGIARALEAGDGEELAAWLGEIDREMDGFAGDGAAVEAWEGILASAFVNGLGDGESQKSEVRRQKAEGRRGIESVKM